MKSKIKMIKRIGLVALLVGVFYTAWSFYQPGNDRQRDQVLLQLMTYGLEQVHYSPKDFNDELSEATFDLYLQGLDPGKRIFTQKQIDELNIHRQSIDDEVLGGSMAFFDLSYGMYNQQFTRVVELYRDILGEKFDFDIEEEVEMDGEKRTYPKDDNELREVWRKYLKYQVMTRISDMVDEQEEEEEKLSFEEMEEKAREKVLKNMDRWAERMEELDRNDWESVYFNSMISVFDPHSAYLPPYDQEAFEISMSGKLEGIGAQLSDKDGYITVVKIVSGSASWRQGELEVNDVILKVAQEGEEPVDIVDMRIEEAVKLIRGPKGTNVILSVKKLDGSVTDIQITRDVVILEETYAKSAVLEDGTKIGYIRLPKFYLNYDGEGRDCAEDVRNELERLKEEGVEGIVFDLRNNGGGSLQAAIDIAGLFIDEGPMVQVKLRNRGTKVYNDEYDDIVWDGPLVVMVNAFSASASEILAGALQDYDRAVIIGGNQTYGKGTVQSIFELDPMLNDQMASVKPLGALKMTIQKFYRVNGHSTQLEGVVPDIILPETYSYIPNGERETDYPLAWDEIESTDFTDLDEWDQAISNAVEKSSKRTTGNEQFAAIDENAKWVSSRRDETLYTLNFEEYQKEQSELEARNKAYRELRDSYSNGLNAIALPSDSFDPSDTVKVEMQERFIENLEGDVYLGEAFEVATELARRETGKK
jgi:carboxyl-terminal processing protease